MLDFHFIVEEECTNIYISILCLMVSSNAVLLFFALKLCRLFENIISHSLFIMTSNSLKYGENDGIRLLRCAHLDP